MGNACFSQAYPIKTLFVQKRKWKFCKDIEKSLKTQWFSGFVKVF